jgi:uncharacterized damage-inducible protein DinB
LKVRSAAALPIDGRLVAICEVPASLMKDPCMNVLLDEFNYHRWANLRLIECMDRLDPDLLNRKIMSSFPSIRETLVHILWAEELWLERWQSRSFVSSLRLEDFPNTKAIGSAFEAVHSRQLQFLLGLKSEALDRKVSYVNFRGEKWEYSLHQMIQHLVLHSAYHRGQVATMLRQLEIAPPCTDYLVFVDSQSRTGT